MSELAQLNVALSDKAVCCTLMKLPFGTLLHVAVFFCYPDEFRVSCVKECGSL